MRKQRKNNVFAMLISLAVITLLVLAGPTQAFLQTFTIADTTLTQPEKVKFISEIEINTSERLNIEYLTLKISGQESMTCRFNSDGTLIDECKGVSVQRTRYPQIEYYNGTLSYGYGYSLPIYGYGYGYADLPSYGYGYLYTQGKLVYEITIDTNEYTPGSYKAFLETKVADEIFTTSEKSFRIYAGPKADDDDDDDDDDKSPNGGCVTSWVCSDWSTCENGIQTRSCTKDVLYCYAGPNPEISRTCTDFENLSYNDPDRRIQLRSQEEESNNVVSRITGAVIGLTNTEETNSDSIILLVTIMVLTLGIFTLLLAIRRARIRRVPKTFY